MVYCGFRLDTRGLEPVGTPTREQWSACLDYLTHLSRHVHFWIGDLLVYVQTGTARIESTPGKGTSVTLLFPQAG